VKSKGVQGKPWPIVFPPGPGAFRDYKHTRREGEITTRTNERTRCAWASLRRLTVAPADSKGWPESMFAIGRVLVEMLGRIAAASMAGARRSHAARLGSSRSLEDKILCA
jgi:hypothetical protein